MTTLLSALKENATKIAAQNAIVDIDHNIKINWKELDHLSDQWALWLGQFVNWQEKIVIISQHNFAFPIALLAAWKAGAVPLLINEEMTEKEFTQVQQDLRLNDPLILIDSNFEQEIKSKWAKLTKRILYYPAENIKTDGSPPRIRSTDIALGLLTSGTTSTPKIIFFTHENLFQGAWIEQNQESWSSDENILNLRPQFSSGGLNTWWPSLIIGCTNYYSEKMRRVPIGRFLIELINRECISLTVLSPSYISTLVQTVDKDLKLNRKTKLYFGGMRLSPNTLKIIKNLGFLPSMRYGMTEVSHIISKSDPLIGHEIHIPVDNQGYQVEVVGNKITICSPGTAEYLMKDGHMLQLLSYGKFVTDDRGDMLSSGEIRLIGRDEQTICVNGFRFQTQQVEAILMGSGLLEDCRVLGLNHLSENEKIVVFCLGDEKRNKDTFVQYAQKNLSRYKRPYRYIWLADWPYTTNGKIDLKALKARAQREDN